jgi:hypothetical protein
MKQREIEFAEDICDVIFGFVMLVRYKTWLNMLRFKKLYMHAKLNVAYFKILKFQRPLQFTLK